MSAPGVNRGTFNRNGSGLPGQLSARSGAVSGVTAGPQPGSALASFPGQATTDTGSRDGRGGLGGTGSTGVTSASQPPGSVPLHHLKQVSGNLGQLSIEQAYPGMFLEPTRENLRKLQNQPELSAEYVRFAFKPVDVTKEQFAAMKAEIVRELSKHFIALGTRKGVGFAIKKQLPSLDCSTVVFKDLRKYGNTFISNLKHDFLYEKLFTHIDGLVKEFPTETANKNQNQLIQFLGNRFDADLVKQLLSTCIKVLDVELTFAKRDSIACWYLKQMYVNTAVVMIPLVKSETKMNHTLRWVKRAPTGWEQDRNLRAEVSSVFDNLSTHENFKDVELSSFKWTPELDTSAAASKSSRRRTLAATRDLVFTSPPPPAEMLTPRPQTIAQPIPQRVPHNSLLRGSFQTPGNVYHAAHGAQASFLGGSPASAPVNPRPIPIGIPRQAQPGGAVGPLGRDPPAGNPRQSGIAAYSPFAGASGLGARASDYGYGVVGTPSTQHNEAGYGAMDLNGCADYEEDESPTRAHAELLARYRAGRP